jgi:hypothetical protein
MHTQHTDIVYGASEHPQRHIPGPEKHAIPREPRNLDQHSRTGKTTRRAERLARYVRDANGFKL